MYPLVLEHMHVIYIPFTSCVDMERSPQKQVYIQDYIYYRAPILLVISTTHIQILRHGLSPTHDVYSCYVELC